MLPAFIWLLLIITVSGTKNGFNWNLQKSEFTVTLSGDCQPFAWQITIDNRTRKEQRFKTHQRRRVWDGIFITMTTRTTAYDPNAAWNYTVYACKIDTSKFDKGKDTVHTFKLKLVYYSFYNYQFYEKPYYEKTIESQTLYIKSGQLFGAELSNRSCIPIFVCLFLILRA